MLYDLHFFIIIEEDLFKDSAWLIKAQLSTSLRAVDAPSQQFRGGCSPRRARNGVPDASTAEREGKGGGTGTRRQHGRGEEGRSQSAGRAAGASAPASQRRRVTPRSGARSRETGGISGVGTGGRLQ